jgi:fatty acid desaturase
MTIQEKLNLLRQDWAYLISLKAGKVVEKNNKCYQVSKWIAWIFHFYYYSGFPFILIFFLIYISSVLSDILYMRIIYAILILLIFEFFLFVLIPINKTKCWKIYKIGKN